MWFRSFFNTLGCSTKKKRRSLVFGWPTTLAVSFCNVVSQEPPVWEPVVKTFVSVFEMLFSVFKAIASVFKKHFLPVSIFCFENKSGRSSRPMCPSVRVGDATWSRYVATGLSRRGQGFQPSIACRQTCGVTAFLLKLMQHRAPWESDKCFDNG